MRAWIPALIVALLAPTALAGGDAPTISRHRGKRGGVVVLWPRVVPEEAGPEVDALAGQVQQRLGQIALRASSADRLITRPEPERVCPQAGCRAVSLGAVLGHHEGGCFAVGLIGDPLGGSVRMVPWAGDVLATRRNVEFRSPPESSLVVTEFVPCDQLLAELDDQKIEKALARALESPAQAE